MCEVPEKEVLRRHRVLSIKDRIAILTLYDGGGWTMKELGLMFAVSQPRISQIVNDTYGERTAVQHGD